MEQNSYCEIIAAQTERALWEVKNVIDCIPDALWDRIYCDMPLWKHVYHTLHSLDQWFINPMVYAQPPFHCPALNDLDVVTEGYLSRDEIQRYTAFKLSAELPLHSVYADTGAAPSSPHAYGDADGLHHCGNGAVAARIRTDA